MLSTVSMSSFSFHIKHWHILQFHSLTLSYVDVLKLPITIFKNVASRTKEYSYVVWSMTAERGLPPINPLLVILLINKMGFPFGGVISNCCFMLNLQLIQLPGLFYLICCEYNLFNPIFIFLTLYEEIFIFFCFKNKLSKRNWENA